MAKRSPILGYNHNVQYRGVVFHVQTEDSGIINPHIFTHLFHAGVIVNTRKLVYDPDADDGVVKSLMQSQHKAILRELKRGAFDDKIDVYLANIPGLLPRGHGALFLPPHSTTPLPWPVYRSTISLMASAKEYYAVTGPQLPPISPSKRAIISGRIRILIKAHSLFTKGGNSPLIADSTAPSMALIIT